MAEIKNNHGAESRPASGRSDEDIEQSTEEVYTERGLERKNEDEKYVPVIIKRSDETVRHPDDVLEKAIGEGLEQVERPFWSLLLSSIGAGLILGFTAMAVAVMATLTSELNASQFLRISMALVYPLGFIICIMSGTQLFTEHTATAVYPLFAKKITMKRLVRLWLVVIFGNLIGALGSAGLLTLADKVIMAREGYILIGHHLVHQDNLTLLVSALLAGWLMALGGWLVLVTSPALSQIVCIYIVTFLIGLGGLHHSIAGSVEMFTVLMVSDEYHILQGLKFIGLALVGNLIGGSIFVAGFNYSHIRRTQQV
ncbi:formate/nitrite transporter family protein [Desulfogranum marinum]|uniref:formate/nitrite transporter family protein n=1 Tax=Desulfogranum marinum TaxID=453220 RepID=UPI0019655216|nr:formate/nitrite transporter family protein [Desulfogranum marinum]MBM9514463.1 formate/nitrite transporter family protein [Desulfogranum marinum]